MSYLNARSGSITHSSFQSGYMSKSSVQPGYITHSSTRRRYLSHWSAQPGYMKDSSAQLGYMSNWRFLLGSAVCNTRLKGKVLYKFIVGVYLPTVLVRNLTFQCTVWKKNYSKLIDQLQLECAAFIKSWPKIKAIIVIWNLSSILNPNRKALGVTPPVSYSAESLLVI